MSPYASEFARIAVAHLLAVASPGPDFAMVLRQSLAHGRRTAVWTSVGIGSAILLHATYCVLGLGLLLLSAAAAFTVLKYAGAAYLTFLGVEGLRSRRRSADNVGLTGGTAPGPRAAFAAGFLTNALNPKAALFFIALFPVVVSPETPKLIQAGYGLWMSLATMAWFSLVSLVFTRETVRRSYLRQGHWIDRALGVVFLTFAAGLLFG
ncbi:MAG: Threonine efflux protein [Verrucomicrobiota bacterium]|jgi:RhtB (resistance to homoserine/threonine) family protein